MGIKKAQIKRNVIFLKGKEKINTSKNETTGQNISVKYMVMDYTMILFKTHK